MNSDYENYVLAAQAGDIVESNGFEPMPNGDYILRLVELDVKDTRALDGKYINCMFDVCEENNAFVGRKVFKMFNFINKSHKAQQIGLGQLKSFCRVTIGELDPTQQFTIQHINSACGIPFIAKMKQVKNNLTGEMDNEIASFVSIFDPMAQNAHSQTPIPQQEPAFNQPSFAQQAQQSGGFKRP